MEVDHFKPKGKFRNSYSNLLPATRHCNGAKGQNWPTVGDNRLGIRFLNPTVEADYDSQIFEDPKTHKLIGTTPAAIFHIRVLDLNADHLISERRERARIITALSDTPAVITGSFKGVTDSINALRDQLALMIPPILAPPSAGSK